VTRRGTLAYYLAAWVCGCFFISLPVWLHATAFGDLPFSSPPGVAGLLVFYFYSLIFGLLAALIGAFLLRRITALLAWRKAWQWVLAGAVLAPSVALALGHAGAQTLGGQTSMDRLLSLAMMGPAVVVQEGAWLTAPGGAATAFILFQIHTTFGDPAPAVPPTEKAPSV
jgi:hypothetical protein